jgi:hypothetical protein
VIAEEAVMSAITGQFRSGRRPGLADHLAVTVILQHGDERVARHSRRHLAARHGDGRADEIDGLAASW